MRMGHVYNLDLHQYPGFIVNHYIIFVNIEVF